MHGEYAELVTEHGRKPEIARQLSFEMYEDWATQVLLKPKNLGYYRLKTIEETQEFLNEKDPEKVIEEAGDMLWSLVTGRKLTYEALEISDVPDFYGATLESITQTWTFDMSGEELGTWLKEKAYLFQRKMKLAIWVQEPIPNEKTRRDYIINVIDGLIAPMIAAIAQITHNKTGKNIEDILIKNIDKLEARIANNDLDKTTRLTVASRENIC